MEINKESIEYFDEKCKVCEHTFEEHKRPVENMDSSDPKFEGGVCKKEECDCKKFKDKEE